MLFELQITASLRGGEISQFSTGELESFGFCSSREHAKQSGEKTLHKRSLPLGNEVFRIQEMQKYSALILRFVKDQIASTFWLG